MNRTEPREPMICPACGIPMNHHAEKLVEAESREDADGMDPVIGGVVEEIHECPGCGCVGKRRGE